MTREEILAMEAGLQLNILVAEEIFGYKIFAGETASTSEKVLITSKVLHYSTDISAAWQVAEKVGLAIFRLNNGEWVVCRPNYIYHIEITQDHYADPNLIICKTASEAICKAALLAKQ